MGGGEGGPGSNLHQLFAVKRSAAHFLCCVLGHLSTDGSRTKAKGILIAGAALGVPRTCQGRAVAVLWSIQGIFLRLILPWPAQEDQRASFRCHTLQSKIAETSLAGPLIMHTAWLNSDCKAANAGHDRCLPHCCRDSIHAVQFWQKPLYLHLKAIKRRCKTKHGRWTTAELCPGLLTLTFDVWV